MPRGKKPTEWLNKGKQDPNFIDERTSARNQTVKDNIRSKRALGEAVKYGKVTKYGPKNSTKQNRGK